VRIDARAARANITYPGLAPKGLDRLNPKLAHIFIGAMFTSYGVGAARARSARMNAKRESTGIECHITINIHVDKYNMQVSVGLNVLRVYEGFTHYTSIIYVACAKLIRINVRE
jgi:hypothetical protein